MTNRLVFFAKNFKGVFLKKKKLFLSVFIGIFLNICGWIALKLFFPFTQETVILHYNAFLGIDQVEFNFSTNKIRLFFPLINGLIIWVINFGLGMFLYFSQHDLIVNEDKKIENFRINQLGAYLLWLVGNLVQMFILVYILAIILINS